MKMKNKLKKDVGRRGTLYLQSGIWHKIKLLNCDKEFVKILDLGNLTIRYIKVIDVERFDTHA